MKEDRHGMGFQVATRRHVGLIVLGVLGLSLLLVPELRTFDLKAWFLTPDQQGDRLLKKGDAEGAIGRYKDPMRAGAVAFQTGQFKTAAELFGRVHSEEGHFNRGNALLMLGQYVHAMEAYDIALTKNPEWHEPAENREIARLRAEQMKLEGGDMTGGMLGADDVVSTVGPNESRGEKQTEDARVEPLSDTELQSMWLRRIQTKPADFLRAKFAYQAMTQGDSNASEGERP